MPECFPVIPFLITVQQAAKSDGMRIQLSTDHLPDRDRISFWHEVVCQQNFHVTPLWDGDVAGFRATADIHIAGRFILADLHTSHGSVEKTASDISRGASDSVLVYQAVASGQHYQVGPHGYDLVPGDVCIVPMDRRFQGTAGSIAIRSLLVPHAVLGPLMAGRELGRTHHLKGDSPLGHLLGASLTTAASQVPLLTDALGDAVLANLCGLVALAAGTSDEGHQAGQDAVRVARLHLVKQHISKHLSSPVLAPALVAAALGMSVRQLHMLFQPTGDTFTHYVLRRRLEACRVTLSSPAAAGRSVADVAFSWGFNSLSVFYRAFTLAFGVPPNTIRLQQDRR